MKKREMLVKFRIEEQENGWLITVIRGSSCVIARYVFENDDDVVSRASEIIRSRRKEIEDAEAA